VSLEGRFHNNHRGLSHVVLGDAFSGMGLLDPIPCSKSHHSQAQHLGGQSPQLVYFGSTDFLLLLQPIRISGFEVAASPDHFISWTTKSSVRSPISELPSGGLDGLCFCSLAVFKGMVFLRVRFSFIFGFATLGGVSFFYVSGLRASSGSMAMPHPLQAIGDRIRVY